MNHEYPLAVKAAALGHVLFMLLPFKQNTHC